jgi:hypothetical protein
MLTLVASQPESLWDESLPVEVKQPPADLAALDVLLCGHELLWPIVERWQREFEQTGRRVLTEGRPTIAIETYVRLMVLKQRYRWGYRTLVAEVSDSIHLRRFCRIGLGERVPDESTVRKLTRRIGSGGEDRLDRDRGGCEVPHRCGAGVQRRAGVGAGGAQAGEGDQGQAGAGAGPLAFDGSQAAGDHAHDPSAHRRSQDRGAQADGRDGRAAS